jgi:Ca2+-binding EF-hand superfamily protein
MNRIDPILAEVEEMFERIDTDGDRVIGFEEFSKLMRTLDHTRAAPSLRDNFDAIDTNRDGRVSFDEFRAWCGGWR